MRQTKKIETSESFRRFFKTISFFTFPTHLPDHALGSKLTVGAGVGAGLTVIQTLLTIPYLHFLAFDIGFAIRMIFALHTAPQYDFLTTHPDFMNMKKSAEKI